MSNLNLCVSTAPGPVGDLNASFVEMGSTFDSDNHVYSINITITWSAPSLPNGEITSYNVTVYRTDDCTDVVYSNDTLTDTSVTPLVMVPAFTDYTVTVAASTSAGQGEAVSLTIESPQAGINTLYIINYYVYTSFLALSYGAPNNVSFIQYVITPKFHRITLPKLLNTCCTQQIDHYSFSFCQ